MKEIFKFGLVLGIICLVASGLLAGVNSLTKPKILAQAKAEEESGLKEVLPSAARFEPVRERGEVIYYRGLSSAGVFVGVVFKAGGKGYSSTIETLAGMLKDGRITAIKVLSQNETPGLGSRVSEPEFGAKFKDVKDISKVQGIAGATISSRAVVNSVREKAGEVLARIKNEK